MEEALPNPNQRRKGGLRTIPFIICKSIIERPATYT